jgi:hypothetical protein
VKFKITRHSGFSAPPDALDQLFERLPARRDAVSFSRAGSGITATWGEDVGISRTEEELAAIGRLEVLDVVFANCEDEPSLRADWFAVSALR